MATLRLIVLAAAIVGLAAPAAADEKKSVYSKLDLAECREEPPDPDDPLQSGSWWCEGYDGIPVYVTEGDLRFTVSYGENPLDEKAASETLPSFNHIGTTLEWRLDGGRPFATILRFFADGESDKSQYLVITRLGGPGEVCHVGRVMATANPDANEIAREVADEVAPRFRCGEEEPLDYGLTGDDAAE